MAQKFRNWCAGSQRNSLDHASCSHQWSLQSYLSVKSWRSTYNVRDGTQLRNQWLPVLNAVDWIALQNVHVCRCAQQTGLKRALKSVINCKRDDQGRYSRPDAQYRKDCYDRDDCLLALCSQVANRDHPLEARHQGGNRPLLHARLGLERFGLECAQSLN